MASLDNSLTLITGGTGKTGSRLAKLMKDSGYPVRIGSRAAAPAFDWNDRGTWQGALAGVSSVYVAFQPDLTAPGALAIVQAFFAQALAAGARKIVLLSGRGEEEAEAAEQALMATRADWTILRASWFNQNFTEGFGDVIRTGTLALPVGPIPEPFIDADDIAEVAFAALTRPGHSHKLYELTGPRALTFAEAAAEIAGATGRSLRFEQVSADAFKRDALAQGLPEATVALMLHLFITLFDGRNTKTADGVAQALGRPPRDFSAFVKQAATSKIWEADHVGA